jgi:hypothetical protein
LVFPPARNRVDADNTAFCEIGRAANPNVGVEGPFIPDLLAQEPVRDVAARSRSIFILIKRLLVNAFPELIERVGCTNSNWLMRPAHIREPARQADRVAPQAERPGGLDCHSPVDRSAA